MTKKRDVSSQQQALPFGKVGDPSIHFALNQKSQPESGSSQNTQGERRGNHFHLYVDGAARNNPGPAAAGMYLTKEGEPLIAKGYYLGTKTNNQAEYLGLILGLMHAQKHMQPHDDLSIFADSQLLVRQINGEYAVRNQGLQPLYVIARKLLQPYQRSRMTHIYREHNTQADQLANEGLDNKIVIPKPMKDWLQEHGIII